LPGAARSTASQQSQRAPVPDEDESAQPSACHDASICGTGKTPAAGPTHPGMHSQGGCRTQSGRAPHLPWTVPGPVMSMPLGHLWTAFPVSLPRSGLCAAISWDHPVSTSTGNGLTEPHREVSGPSSVVDGSPRKHVLPAPAADRVQRRGCGGNSGSYLPSRGGCADDRRANRDTEHGGPRNHALRVPAPPNTARHRDGASAGGGVAPETNGEATGHVPRTQEAETVGRPATPSAVPCPMCAADMSSWSVTARQRVRGWRWMLCAVAGSVSVA